MRQALVGLFDRLDPVARTLVEEERKREREKESERKRERERERERRRTPSGPALQQKCSTGLCFLPPTRTS